MDSFFVVLKKSSHHPKGLKCASEPGTFLLEFVEVWEFRMIFCLHGYRAQTNTNKGCRAQTVRTGRKRMNEENGRPFAFLTSLGER